MINIIRRMYNDKREYREQMARIKALPEDYRFVFEKMQNYMWSLADGHGFDMLKTQYDLIDLFEMGAAEGKPVLDVTGQDVAGFCDELIRGNKLWKDSFRHNFNLRMRRKL